MPPVSSVTRADKLQAGGGAAGACGGRGLPAGGRSLHQGQRRCSDSGLPWGMMVWGWGEGGPGSPFERQSKATPSASWQSIFFFFFFKERNLKAQLCISCCHLQEGRFATWLSIPGSTGCTTEVDFPAGQAGSKTQPCPTVGGCPGSKSGAGAGGLCEAGVGGGTEDRLSPGS